MARGFDQGVLGDFRTLFSAGAVSQVSDGLLLERYLKSPGEGSEVAFGTLIQRHGPMVLGVCRKILKDAQETEDAFQATFLVLARKAQSIRSRENLGAWLFGVARKIALRAKSNAHKRMARERRVAEQATRRAQVEARPIDEVEVLLQEVQRLPGKLRDPVILFYFQGQSYEHTAQALQMTEGSIRGRLARARVLLRARLEGRGFSAGLLIPGSFPRALAEDLPHRLVEPILRFAMKISSGESPAGIVSVSVASLMEGALKAMFITKFKIGLGLAIVIGLISAGTSVRGYAWQKPNVKPKVGADGAPQGETSALGELVQGRIVRSAEVAKDCMVLSFMPDWAFGNVDNIAIAGSAGGVRTLVNWPDVPASEAKSTDLKFYLAFYSRSTTSKPKPGSIAAFEITSEWVERTSWKALPSYETEPIASTKFEPGEGWKVFEITPFVREREGKSGNGLLLRFLIEDRPSNGAWSGYQFVSREGQGEWAKRRPMLLVVEPSKK